MSILKLIKLGAQSLFFVILVKQSYGQKLDSVNYEYYLNTSIKSFLKNDNFKHYDYLVNYHHPPSILQGVTLFFEEEGLAIHLIIIDFEFVDQFSRRGWKMRKVKKERIGSIKVEVLETGEITLFRSD